MKKEPNKEKSLEKQEGQTDFNCIHYHSEFASHGPELIALLEKYDASIDINMEYVGYSQYISSTVYITAKYDSDLNIISESVEFDLQKYI